jgi:hypothetical protein
MEIFENIKSFEETKLGDGLDESPTVMVGYRNKQLSKNRGMLINAQLNFHRDKY